MIWKDFLDLLYIVENNKKGIINMKLKDLAPKGQRSINEGNSIINNIQFVVERIKASQAYDTVEGVQTVIDGKRELTFITTMDNPIYRPNNEIELEAMQHGLDNGLKAIEVKGKPDGKAWVLYKKDKKAAQKLADYAESKGGYLSDNTPEEAEYVGDLLGYNKNDIKSFIKRVYKISESRADG